MCSRCSAQVFTLELLDVLKSATLAIMLMLLAVDRPVSVSEGAAVDQEVEQVVH